MKKQHITVEKLEQTLAILGQILHDQRSLDLELEADSIKRMGVGHSYAYPTLEVELSGVSGCILFHQLEEFIRDKYAEKFQFDRSEKEAEASGALPITDEPPLF